MNIFGHHNGISLQADSDDVKIINSTQLLLSTSSSIAVVKDLVLEVLGRYGPWPQSKAKTFSSRPRPRPALSPSEAKTSKWCH